MLLYCIFHLKCSALYCISMRKVLQICIFGFHVQHIGTLSTVTNSYHSCYMFCGNIDMQRIVSLLFSCFPVFCRGFLNCEQAFWFGLTLSFILYLRDFRRVPITGVGYMKYWLHLLHSACDVTLAGGLKILIINRPFVMSRGGGQLKIRSE